MRTRASNRPIERMAQLDRLRTGSSARLARPEVGRALPIRPYGRLRRCRYHSNMVSSQSPITTDRTIPSRMKGAVRQHGVEFRTTQIRCSGSAGATTIDEMAHAWVDLTYLNQSEFDAMVTERKANAKRTTADGQR